MCVGVYLSGKWWFSLTGRVLGHLGTYTCRLLTVVVGCLEASERQFLPFDIYYSHVRVFWTLCLMLAIAFLHFIDSSILRSPTVMFR